MAEHLAELFANKNYRFRYHEMQTAASRLSAERSQQNASGSNPPVLVA